MYTWSSAQRRPPFFCPKCHLILGRHLNSKPIQREHSPVLYNLRNDGIPSFLRRQWCMTSSRQANELVIFVRPTFFRVRSCCGNAASSWATAIQAAPGSSSIAAARISSITTTPPASTEAPPTQTARMTTRAQTTQKEVRQARLPLLQGSVVGASAPRHVKQEHAAVSPAKQARCCFAHLRWPPPKFTVRIHIMMFETCSVCLTQTVPTARSHQTGGPRVLGG